LSAGQHLAAADRAQALLHGDFVAAFSHALQVNTPAGRDEHQLIEVELTGPPVPVDQAE
jgi:hypothetical protein